MNIDKAMKLALEKFQTGNLQSSLTYYKIIFVSASSCIFEVEQGRRYHAI
jgi:hypothetical protein